MSRSRNHRLTVGLLGSGWAAIELADYEDMDWGTDVTRTGIGRYKTREEAIKEAECWSGSDQLPLFLDNMGG